MSAAEVEVARTVAAIDAIHSSTAATKDASANVGHPADQLQEELPAPPTSGENEITGTRFYVLFLSICLVLIIAQMDSSIVAVAVPAITDHFHTVSDIGWYSSAYRLCLCSFQFLFGKLYKMFSFKRIFLISVALFLLGSTLCSAAQSSLMLVVGRAVAGVASSGIVAGAFAFLVKTVPLRRRPLFTGIAGALEGISPIAAPVIGGFLVEINWRWCFIISIPSGGLVFILLAIFLEELPPAEQTTWRQRLKELDLIGNLVLIPSLTSLFMALGWAGSTYAWNSAQVIALFCVFAVLLGAFAVDQWIKGDAATLPPRILKNRSILAGCVFTLCCSSSIYTVEYFLPTWLQAVKEYSAQKSGILMIPGVVAFLVAVLLQGSAVNAVGYYVPFMLTASILMPIFAGLLTTLTVATSIGTVVTFMVFLSFAAGIGFQTPQIAVQNSLPESDTLMGLAIILFFQGFGPSLFVMVAQTIFTNRLSASLQQLGSPLSAKAIENLGLSDLKGRVGKAQLHDVLLGLDSSIVQTFYLPVALACVTLVGSASMEWKNVKHKRN